MKILLDGEVRLVAPSCTLTDVFQQLRIDLATHCAVAVNVQVILVINLLVLLCMKEMNYCSSILLLVDKHCYAISNTLSCC